MTKEQIVVKETCNQCNELHQIHVYSDDYKAWKNGQLSHVAMPYVPKDMRTLLFSGMCGSCFDELFDQKNS